MLKEIEKRLYKDCMYEEVDLGLEQVKYLKKEVPIHL
jgi:hypothetical protein